MSYRVYPVGNVGSEYIVIWLNSQHMLTTMENEIECLILYSFYKQQEAR